MSASKLDIEKLRKVRGLIDGGATAGERDAARSRATAIAAKAGMTLAQALSKLDIAERPAQPANIFKGFDDWMEEKEPGYKAKKARELTEREMRNAAKRAEILKQFGTVKAFFSPTSREAILHTAGKPFVTKYSTYTDVCGTRRKDAREFAGVTNVWKLDVVNPDAVAAIKTEIPFPDSICGAFAELKEWDKLNNDRALFYDHGEYYFDLRVELRIELLRDVMRTAPATSWDDLEARFRFKAYAWEQQWIDEQTFDDPEWSRLYGDFCILRDKATSDEIRTMSAAEDITSSYTPVQNGRPVQDTENAGTPAHCGPGGVQFGHRSTADKRRAVLSILDDHPDLTDREISRRAGVSPQTVNNWRNKIKGRNAA